MFSLAVDVMGGDLGPHTAFKACRKLLHKRPDVRLILLVTDDCIAGANHLFGRNDRVTIIQCQSQIDPNAKPSRALRDGLTSTMAQALHEVKEGRAQAVLSSGNTGALMALSLSILGTLDGVDRPALATLLPTRDKPVLMLDLGANLNVPNSLMMQFAAMGVCWAQQQMNCAPSLGLLNVGKEASKGTERLKEMDANLHTMLAEHYSGFCEGHDIFQGKLDVVVTDGFVGNVVLKASESLSNWLIEQIGDEFRRHWLRRWLWPLWYSAVTKIERKMSPARQSGALLLGIDGMVVKTHGGSDVRTFFHALDYVLNQVERFDVEHYKQAVKNLQEKLK